MKKEAIDFCEKRGRQKKKLFLLCSRKGAERFRQAPFLFFLDIKCWIGKNV